MSTSESKKRPKTGVLMSSDYTSNSPSFSPEILELILSKLPAKSVLLCESVSKSLRALILNPYFTKILMEKSESHKGNTFILTPLAFPKYNPLRYLVANFDSEDGVMELGPPLYEPSSLALRPSSVLCTCSGSILVRMGDHIHIHHMLWNPSIGKLKKFIILGDDVNNMKEGFGMCYDPINDDFKIVFLSTNKYLVHSFNTGRGRLRDSIDGGGVLRCKSARAGISLNGAIYWIVLVIKENKKYLLKFDSKDDRLYQLEIPECFNDHRYRRFYLDTLRGSLYLWVWTTEGRLLCLWVINFNFNSNGKDQDHSWTRVMSIKYGPKGTPAAIWFIKEGKEILICEQERAISRYADIYTYDLAEKRYRRFEGPPFGYSSFLVPYVDSHVFARQGREETSFQWI